MMSSSSGGYTAVPVPGTDDEEEKSHSRALEMNESPIPARTLYPSRPKAVTFALDDEVDVLDDNGGTIFSRNRVSNNLPVPISRPPTKPRDGLFAVAFFSHFVVISLLSLFEGHPLKTAIFDYSNAGSWSSMIMIVILLGSFVGLAVVGVVAFVDARETLLSLGMLLSITMQACLGNILLILQTRFSFLGVLVLLSALLDSLSYKKARDGICFTSALIQMAVEVLKKYGSSLVIACAVIIAVQTFVLLWWGAFFVDLISGVSSSYAEPLMVLMALSLYWIANFFHSFISYVVGGCVLWHFVKKESEPLLPGKRILLHMQCGVTSSLGSICKGALFCPISQRILSIYNWSNRSRYVSNSLANQFRNAVLNSIFPLVSHARRFHRLTFCLTAVYGRTLCKAADEQMESHPETIDLSVEDSTHFTLLATATELAGLISIVFGIVAERREGSSWPLFFFVCFCLAYCGLSVAVHIFNSAVDALVVAFGTEPQRFALENQIVFLRFLRETETR